MSTSTKLGTLYDPTILFSFCIDEACVSLAPGAVFGSRYIFLFPSSCRVPPHLCVVHSMRRTTFVISQTSRAVFIYADICRTRRHQHHFPMIIRLVNFIARSFAFSSSATALTSDFVLRAERSERRIYKQPKQDFRQEGNAKCEELICDACFTRMMSSKSKSLRLG